MTVPSSIRGLAWLLMVLAGLIVLAVSLFGTGEGEYWLETDVTHLLPEAAEDPVLQSALGRDQGGASQQWLLLLEGPSDKTRELIGELREDVLASGLAEPPPSLDGSAVRDTLTPWRFHLHEGEQLERLAVDPVSATWRRVQGRLARPSPGGGLAFDRDPAGFLETYLQSQPSPYPGFEQRRGAWQQSAESAEDRWFLPLRLKANAFDAHTQAEHQQWLDDARHRLAEECEDCRLLSTGPVHFAEAQSSLARQEAVMISSLSLGGILILMWLAFASIRPLLLGALALASGVLIALTVSLLVFGRIHVITLVAGSTLLGIAIDYVFKYLVHRADMGADSASGQSLDRRLNRPLLLGVSSSLLCLAVLALSPFPLLRELAIYSAAGLFGAWLTVMTLFPWLDRHMTFRLRPGLIRCFNAPRRLAQLNPRAPLKKVFRWSLLALLPLGALAFWQMPGSDDLRHFQAELPELLERDQGIREKTGTRFPDGFFLIRGEDPGQVMEREHRLRQGLRSTGHRAVPISLSSLIPPEDDQRRGHALVGEALHDEALENRLREIGLSESALARLQADWASGRGQTLQPEELLEGPLAPMVEALWISGEQGPASLLIPRDGFVAGLDDQAMAAVTPDGVAWIQPMAEMNQALSQQRAAASRWILLAAVIGLPLLFALALGWRRGLPAALAPLMALAICLIFLWASGIGINTFVLMGLILGLGVGADYSAFLAFDEAADPATMTGIGLAGLTTLLAFGLLGLSQLPALGEFGLTVVVAVAAAYLCAILWARAPSAELPR